MAKGFPADIAGDRWLWALRTVAEWLDNVQSGGTSQPAGGNADDDLVSRSEAARRLDVHASTITRLVRDDPTLAESPEPGSKVYWSFVRNALARRRSTQKRDDEIRNRATDRANKKA
jgi:hypothetical protein